MKYLQPHNTRYVNEAMGSDFYGNWDFGNDGENIAATLDIGDNFVVNVKIGNEEGVNFYGIRCTKPLHQVSKQFTDMWGNTFELGGMIIARTCYQKWGTCESSYVLL